MAVSVIIAASGAGRRMGLTVKKQYLPLGGIPLLARTVATFTQHPAMEQIIVVIPPGEAGYARRILKPYCDLDRLTLVEGGSRRQDSVFNGLQRVSPEAELVCIHDGVRPLVTGKLIDAVLEAASRFGAAVPLIPVMDTLKKVSADGFITETVPRELIQRAQTPQIFRRDLIFEAYQKAQVLGLEATDDAYLLEMLDYKVRAVPGDPLNIKITGPADLQVASALLEGRQKKPE